MKKMYPALITLISLTTPLISVAQEPDFKGIVNSLTGFLNSLIPILTGAAMLVFFWGLVEYIVQAGNNEAVEESKQRMIWGVVGLFVIVSIWGIVAFIGGSIGITTN